MSPSPQTRSRRRLGLARLLHAEPGMVIAVGKPRAEAVRGCEWLACLPAPRLLELAPPAPAAGAGAGEDWVQSLEQLLAGCSSKLQEILVEVASDPCGGRAFFGPTEHVSGSGDASAADYTVLDFRNAVIPCPHTEEARSCQDKRRLAVLCLVVGAKPQEPEQVLRIQRRLGQVHCILYELLREAAEQAEIAPTAQPGTCVAPSANFCLELLDHEPFGTRGMLEAFPAAMLVTLFLPEGGGLPCGVYCARVQRHQAEYGVLFAVNQHHGRGGRVSSELCIFRRCGEEGTPRFLHCMAASSSVALGGALEDVRWLRPFYHGFTRLGPQQLRELISADMHAAVQFLWPKGARAAPRLPFSPAPRTGPRTPLPVHLLAQEMLPYACAADLGAWAPTSQFLRHEAERCVPTALAADTATAARARAAAVAVAISG
uniref:Uncharacterized protein n=1 Tax=Alexandrium monilatum TaxID=311494 RepID=A0A7S4QKJ6_9DINO|mmetsp:Transcript_58574/g.174323  ORF Transcript_58574/g.174323 Transcript_58574/m.174323 type:complete len:430 (-) Transcript_58574:68-1357(-)